IGSSVEPTHALAPHRSATHTLLPSRSMATALVEPQVRPGGSFAQPSIVRYGLGRLLFGGMSGAFACAARSAVIAGMALICSMYATTSMYWVSLRLPGLSCGIVFLTMEFRSNTGRWSQAIANDSPDCWPAGWQCAHVDS